VSDYGVFLSGIETRSWGTKTGWTEAELAGGTSSYGSFTSGWPAGRLQFSAALAHIQLEYANGSAGADRLHRHAVQQYSYLGRFTISLLRSVAGGLC
jgi:hypothetical protein